MTADTRTPTERMAAWRRTACAMSEVAPNAMVGTYLMERYTLFEHNLLAVLVPRVHLEGETLDATAVTGLAVEDEPGSVAARFALGNVGIDARLTPLPVGDEEVFEGAACYEIGADTPVPMSVWVGTGTAFFALNAVLRMVDAALPAQIAELVGAPRTQPAPLAPSPTHVDGDVVWFRGGQEQFAVAIATDGELDTTDGLEIGFPSGGGRLVVAFAGEPERAVELARTDAGQALAAIEHHYDLLLANHIETPDPVLDAAFRSAIYNLEYTWIPPYGWVECLHHWSALWHMQHTAGAEWLGQSDRARRSILVHGERLLPGGTAPNSAVSDVGIPLNLRPDQPLPGAAVPQLTPSGHTHRDFGGSNQFWAWQIARHWRFTGDTEFAREIAPQLDQVLEHTLAECDADGDGLFSWGFQIGNQEDYITTPGAGATPTIEGIAMARTRAELARVLDDDDTVERWEAKAADMSARLDARLWLADLGRYAFFAEQNGHARLDGQYHTFLYPAIYRMLDPFAIYTTVRHVLDRLTGTAGEVYCSNNFPYHAVGTWGMQAGAAQQPWAAWGLAAAGRWDQVWKPLRAAAGWVMDDNHRGSWPEVSTEATPAYFSPPAGLFVAAVCEALFGLHVNRSAGHLEISPAFPDHWPAARLEAGDVTAVYSRDGDRREYTVTTSDPLTRSLRFPLPVGRPRQVLVNGKPARYRIEPGVGHVVLVVDARRARRTSFTVDWEAADVHITHRGWVAEGDEVPVTVRGASIEGVDDPCGITAGTRLDSGGVAVRVRDGLLAPYEGFGPLGQMMFARRSVFLRCHVDEDVAFWHPVDVTIVPPVQVAVPRPTVSALDVPLLVRNNRDRRLRGLAHLTIGGESIPVAVDVPPRDERELDVQLPARPAAVMCPGANPATFTIPVAGRSVDVDIRVVAALGADQAGKTDLAARFHALQLPEDLLASDEEFEAWRRLPTRHHPPWWNATAPLEELTGRNTITMPGLPGVPFQLHERRVVPVSLATSPRFELPLPAEPIAKVILIVLPLLDNHDMFSVVGKVSLMGGGWVLTSRLLHFPGDLDWWYPPEAVGDFATARTDRCGGLPLLPALRTQRDWPDARPPQFPQPALWSRSPALVTSGSVLCAVEIGLPSPAAADTVVFEAIGEQAAFGIVAATAISTGCAQPSI